MSIRPIDMQISIAAMNQNNQAHQQAHAVGANAHANVASIKKEDEQNKETVKNKNDASKVGSIKENDEEQKQKKKRQNPNDDKDKDDEELTEEEKEEKEKKAAVRHYIYKLGNNGRIVMKPEDPTADSEGAGHIDYKA